MTYAEVIKKARDDNRLISVLIELTYRCNLDCYFCYNDLGLKGRPMLTETYFRFFEDLRDMQVMTLVLTGGEPLAHPDFFALGRKARELGFVIRLKSNGHSLRGKTIKQIRQEVDPFIIEISLHGACAETHDRQTRVPGSFDRLMVNLRELRDRGIRTKLNCTLTRWNENEVEEIFQLADHLGIQLQISPEVTPRDNGDRDVLSLSPSIAGIRRVFQLRASRARTTETGKVQVEVAREADEGLITPGEKYCGAGSSGIAVDPFGNVYPCVQWRHSVGNLQDQSIKEIWNQSERFLDIRNELVEAKKVVNRYKSKGRLLGFCPGLAVELSGSPTSMYPEAEQRMKILDAVENEGETSELPVIP
jgi:MoaA/NifB/PqqE/SkfB family radical SAM enzyme